MSRKLRLKNRILRKLLPLQLEVPGAQYSMIFPAHNDFSKPSQRLITLALEAVKAAQSVNLDEVEAREKKQPYWTNVWPGEHYKLLAGLVATIKPQLVIEIGTGTGLSSLSMKKYLPANGKIVTFDLVKASSYPDTCLTAADFEPDRLVQLTDDLSEMTVMEKHRTLLEAADLLFIDAAKDGLLGKKLINNFKKLNFQNKPLFIFDDIRLWNMLKIWREISMPKLDLTSFGHWAGTGLVEWL